MAFINETIATIGVVAAVLSVYYAYKQDIITKKTEVVDKEEALKKHYRLAVNHLGNKNVEVRMGAIYDLEKISQEHVEYYWQIMEILTTFIREKSSAKSENVNIEEKLSPDIQTALTVVGRGKHSYNYRNYDNRKSKYFNLQGTYLKGANLQTANFYGANLQGVNLRGANLQKIDLQWANLQKIELKGADLKWANLQGINLQEADLQEADLQWANLQKADELQPQKPEGGSFIISNVIVEEVAIKDDGLHYLQRANLQGADLRGTNLQWTNFNDVNLQEANLLGAKNLTIDQLSKVETLYGAKLDEELEIPLREKYPALFEKPDEWIRY